MLSSKSLFDVVVVGAGIAGLAAAQRIQKSGLPVLVLDKSRGVGGRMATRRDGDNWFDHGAQFITAHGAEFQREVSSWCEAGDLQDWFGKSSGHLRYRGSPSMTAVPKRLASSLKIRKASKIESMEFRDGHWQVFAGEFYKAKHLVLAFPVPQALELIAGSNVVLDPEDLDYLSAIQYSKCLAALFVLNRPSGLPYPGLHPFDHPEPVELMVDNQVKGISKTPSLTVHAGPAFSENYFDKREEAEFILREALSNDFKFSIAGSQIHGWRYARRIGESDRMHYEASPFNLWFCGDSFGPPRIEGAFLSGCAVAQELDKRLNSGLLC